MLLSYQVCHNYSVASWEGGAYSVVSGPGRLIEVDHCLNSLESASPPLCFDLYWAKSAVWTHSYYLVEPILPLTDQITPLWSLLKVSGSVVGFKQPTRAWKHTGGANFSGCHRVIVTDLVAQQHKFVANSRLKKAEKINFLWNLVLIKTVSLLPFFLKDPVDAVRPFSPNWTGSVGKYLLISPIQMWIWIASNFPIFEFNLHSTPKKDIHFHLLCLSL